MIIYGIDFTSAPSRRKPITCAEGLLRDQTLLVHSLERWPCWADFKGFLQHPGPWVAGLDFPFGQPRRLVENVGWPTSWEAYVGVVAGMDMASFAELLERYRTPRPAGDKQHLRATDKLAASRSPMMLYGVPVGRMFFRGAPLLADAGLNILPCRPTLSDRVAVEAYPRLVANKCIGRRGYKHDEHGKQTPVLEAARREIISLLAFTSVAARYNLTLEIGSNLAELLVQDASGDSLDAVLCTLQAAWAYLRRKTGFGMPKDCDCLEGWIVDPELD